MAFKLFRKKIEYWVGIETGVENIYAVEIKYQEGQPVLVNYNEEPLPSPEGGNSEKKWEHLSAALASLTKRFNLHEKEVIAALPGAEVIERIVQMPVMPARELNEAVRWEAEQSIPVPLEDMEFRHLVLGPVPGNGKLQNVLLIAAPSSLVRRFHATCQEVGITLRALDLPTLALWRVFCGLPGSPGEQGQIIILHLDPEITRLVAVSEGTLFFTRTWSGLPGSVSGMPDLDLALPFWTELRRSLEFLRSQLRSATARKVILSGSCASVPDLHALFSRTLELEVEAGLLRLKSQISNDQTGPREEEAELNPRWALAAGLALWGYK
ncbi:MAG: pilus assembly protein PilM [Bacillota bacterium]|nr:pilus assembly protein PilM [Bacillota bacterium]